MIKLCLSKEETIMSASICVKNDTEYKFYIFYTIK